MSFSLAGALALEHGLILLELAVDGGDHLGDPATYMASITAEMRARPRARAGTAASPP
jgi:hypothetical protein